MEQSHGTSSHAHCIGRIVQFTVVVVAVWDSNPDGWPFMSPAEMGLWG
jgi:hypothetical protein